MRLRFTLCFTGADGAARETIYTLLLYRLYMESQGASRFQDRLDAPWSVSKRICLGFSSNKMAQRGGVGTGSRPAVSVSGLPNPHRCQRQVVVQGTVVETALDDLPAQGVQLLGVKLHDLLLEEIRQNLRAGVVALLSQLGLGLRPQEGGADELAVQLHIQQGIPEQGGTGRG